MQVVSNSEFIKKKLDKIYILFWSQFFLAMIGLLGEWLGGNLKFFELLFCGLCLIFCYFFSYKGLKNLYYSFWTFFIFTFFFIFYRWLQVDSSQLKGTSFCFFLTIVLWVFQAFELYSPLFYPKMSWWEYDFRYMVELPANILYQNRQELPCRIIDFKKNIICIVLFETLKIGELIKIRINLFEQSIELDATLVLCRSYLFGRGQIYSAKIKASSLKEKEQLKIFSRFISNYKNEKKFLKFKENYENNNS